MPIGKKKLKLIDQISCYEEILRYYGYTFTDLPPSHEWSKENIQLFDMLVEVENAVKQRVKGILTEGK